MEADLLRQLHGERADVARTPVDKHGLPRSYLRIVEEYLPSRDGSNWNGSRLDKIQGLRFWAIRRAEGSAYSAYPPVKCSFVAPYTSSPVLNPDTPAPIALTIPESSEPKMSGNGSP
jgi:hypothetical protein